MQSLYLKYRPTKLEDFIGNKSAVDSLRSVLERKDGRPHSFLFIGSKGFRCKSWAGGDAGGPSQAESCESIGQLGRPLELVLTR